MEKDFSLANAADFTVMRLHYPRTLLRAVECEKYLDRDHSVDKRCQE
jgi:hypothetical protein